MKVAGKYLSVNKTSSKNKLSDKKFVFTGFRDKNLEKLIINDGGELTSSVSKNTTAVITTDKSGTNSKLAKAEELGIPIYLKNEFLKNLDWK